MSENIENKTPTGDPAKVTTEQVGQITLTKEAFEELTKKQFEAQKKELEAQITREVELKYAKTTAPLAQMPDPMEEAIKAAVLGFKGKGDKEVNIKASRPIYSYQKTLDPQAIASNAAGLYTVPSYVVPEIYQVIGNYGLRSDCRLMMWPEGFGDGSFPTITTKPTIGIGGREAAISDSRNTIGTVTVTFYRLSVIYPITEALLADSAIRAWLPLIMQTVGEQMRRYEDNYIINGTGSSQPRGIVNLSSINTVYLGNASDSGKTSYLQIQPEDVVNCESAVADFTEEGASFMSHKAVHNAIVTSRDTQGRLNYDAQVINPTAFGVAMKKHSLVPHTDGAGNAIGVYGNLKNMLFAQKGEMRVKVADQATIDSVNLFEQDILAYKFINDVAIVSMNDDAFAVLKCAIS